MTLRYLVALALLCTVAAPASAFDVTFGASWDGPSYELQVVLDDYLGAGVVDAATEYEGYLPGDAVVPYWFDSLVDGIVVREIAGNRDTNILGWYVEDEAGIPLIDGVDDGVILSGTENPGETVFVDFGAPTKFGLYLNPNGTGDSNNAPEPELFFANRFYNDIGPDGSGAVHAPFDGDAQALIYNVSAFRGYPSYIVAWEDLDSGAAIQPACCTGTDNDYNDLVIEISAQSPVRTEVTSWGAVKTLYED